MAEPRITIGISCFAEGDWILECWQSVLAQTDDRWRAVLVMDGSEHARTREVFAALSHPRLVKHAMPENRGPYPVRNKAFELTETPYHLYLDGDDQLAPTAVADLLRAFNEDPEAGFAYGDYECFGEGRAKPTPQRYAADVSWDDFAEGQPLPGPCAYRKDSWGRLGGFAAELARGNGDYDFHIGLAEAGVRGRHTGTVFYRYRVGHGARVSSSYERRYHETHEIMVRRHPLFFADPKRRRRFLALGYRRSSLACAAAGEHERAVGHAWTAVRLGLWTDRALWKVLARAGILRRA